MCSKQIEYIHVVFKYGGQWVQTSEQHRKRYDGGKQRSVKFEKGQLTIFALRCEVLRICPWLKGHPYNMYYYIYGTSPKEYKDIICDIHVAEFIEASNDNLCGEIVISVHEVEGQESISDIREVMTSEQIVECSFNEGISIAPSLSYKDIAVGTFFPDAKHFKHALRSVAIKENFGIMIKASDKTRVIATCSYEGCKWRIRASLCEDIQTFEIRRVYGVHTCPGINRVGNKLATTAWVANEIEDIVNRNIDIPPKDINNNLEKDYGLSLPYMKLWKSREHARDNIFGSIDENYKWVPTLHAELLNRNPGSHITYSYDKLDHSFRRFYVCFKVCEDGFLYGCRPLISLDACLLKSKHLGMLLSATSLDGNNGLFPLAFVVVETESKQTWLWFLQNLAESVGPHIEPLSFISDMEKGLGDAIKEIYPVVEHRICIYHATNTSNSVESFNAWIVDARTKPVVDLIDTLRGKLMEQRSARKMMSITWQRELVPHAEDHIREITTRKEHMLVLQSTNSKAEVESVHSRHIVDVESKECTCRVWQLTGLPCIHVVAFIGMKEHPLWHTYVHDLYFVYRYMMAYEGAIGTLPDKDQWQILLF
ncbi:uncharacterized protein LOC110092226 [Dendrobium catenatum]|uniref:uncharacterized protein LOC110092226 n=1 Tax=Dendrobium catenatum TaxID=906689 RepID=UPI0009F1E8F6|nr:uncharacterized protein LOC110092226 [Dendrobium catenatum]